VNLCVVIILKKEKDERKNHTIFSPVHGDLIEPDAKGKPA
jgi:hypothetical protein